MDLIFFASCASVKKKSIESGASVSGTYTAGDVLDLLHVLLVWSVIRQGVSLSLGLVVLHFVDDLRNNQCHTVRSISEDAKTQKKITENFMT